MRRGEEKERRAKEISKKANASEIKNSTRSKFVASTTTTTTAMAASENVVVVAVRAEREISKTALAWALTHIVRPGDVVTLLAVLSDHQASGWRQRLLWGFSRLGGNRESRSSERCQISGSCSQMALQIDGRNEINVRIKVVGSEGSAAASSSSNSKSVHSGTGGGGGGVVVAESRRVGATWVVLDKELKREEKQCMVELHCNIVVMKGSTAKVLRLNVGGIHNKPLPPFSFSLSSSFAADTSSKDHQELIDIPPDDHRNKPARNHIVHRHNHLRDVNAAKNIKSDHKNSKEAKPPPPPPPPGDTNDNGDKEMGSYLYVRKQNPLFERSLLLQKGGRLRAIQDVGSEGEGSTSEPNTNNSSSSKEASPVCAHLALVDYHKETSPPEFSGVDPFAAALPHPNRVYWIPREAHKKTGTATGAAINGNNISPPPATTRTLQERLADPKSNSNNNSNITEDHSCNYSNSSVDVREAVSLIRSSPSLPPPLCSVCRHKPPAFGRPPRQFAYRELEAATDGFSDECFAAEGPSGCIFRGVLEDGQVVAVKQLKGAAAAAAAAAGGEASEEEEFRREVEVLSRAQHRNVVMLIGFCIHGQRRMQVYEYICNGSMDFHLYEDREKSSVLDWEARSKIAAGVARGLRYLHEDCRVGFVVHKDLRPNNILLTHDYEPLIGDFKLTKWQTDTSLSVETNIIPEAFGYLAPEYIEHGIVTDKSDVYAFGVILLELITGRRAMDASQPKGQQFLAEWARPLLSLASEDGEAIANVDRFLDPCLDRGQARFFSQQLRAMARAASLCLRRDPQARPGMSKVLRALEGENVMMEAADHLQFSSVGSRSSRIVRPNLHQEMSAAMSDSFSFRFPEENLALLTALSSEKTCPR